MSTYSYNYLDKGNDVGTILGQSSSKLISFYGIQPVDQLSSLTAAVSTVTYTTATTFTTSIFFTNTATVSGAGVKASTEWNGMMNAIANAQIRIAEMQSRLQECGIIAGGTVVTSSTSSTANDYDVVGESCSGADGVVLGHYTSSLVGFWGITPCDQPAASTTALAVLSMAVTSTAGAMDTTVSIGVTGAYGWGFQETNNVGQSFFAMIAGVQTRLAEMETNLTEVGILAGGTAVTSSDGSYDYLDKGNDSGTILGRASNSKVAFWAGTPCDQAANLTTALATVAYVSSSISATYVMSSMLVGTSTLKPISVTAGNTLVYAVQNMQTRMDEIEAALEGVGLQASN
jgi:hypothetical protein